MFLVLIIEHFLRYAEKQKLPLCKKTYKSESELF